MRLPRTRVLVCFLTTSAALFLLRAASIPRLKQAQGCPAVTFYGDHEAQLVGNGQYTVLVRQPDNSFTALQGTIGGLFPQIQTIPNYQNTLLSCGGSANTNLTTPASPGITSGAGSQSFAIGDIDGLGDMGAVLANGGASITVYRGPNLTFQSLKTYPTGNFTASVVLADVNLDGRPDLVVVNTEGGNAGTGSISILLGNGDGTFQAAVDYATGNSPTTAAVGDLNGDGKPDIVVANSGENDVSILTGNGDGTFQAPVAVAAGSLPNGVLVADFNGDGKADIAVANGASNDLSILIGNGDGTFQPPVNYAVGNGPIYVAAGDLNGDGKLDLAVANHFGNSVSVLLGNGDGTFQTATTYITLAAPTSLVLTDFNSDGRLDVVVGEGSPDQIIPDLSSGTLAVLLGNGDGTLQAANNYPSGRGPKSIAIADFNGDGRPDLVTANQTDNSLSIFLATANGRFEPAMNFSFISMGQSGPSSVTTGDFNGDLKADIAMVSQYSHSFLVMLSNGDGTFKTPAIYPVGSNPVFVISGDFNHDRKLDLAVVDGGSNTNTVAGTVFVLFGNGDGTFKDPVPYTVGIHPGAAVAGDFNGDGYPDLAVSDGSFNGDSGGISVLINNGDGTFKPAVTYNAGVGATFSIAAADFNGDGILDLAAGVFTNSGGTGNVVSILTGKADGTFSDAVNFSTDANPVALAAADLNRDGRLDLVVAHCCGGTDMTYMLGNGDGTFQPEGHFAGGPSPVSVAVADFTGNQIADLAIADQVDSVTVLVNTTPLPPPLTNVSAASFQATALAPESIVSAFGPHLAVGTASTQTTDLPTILGETKVTVVDSTGASLPAPLFYVSPGQVNYQMPSATASGTATVTVRTGDGQRISANVQIARVAPGLFSFAGTNLAAAGILRVTPAGQIVESDYQIDPATKNIIPLPVDLGPDTDQVYLVLYGTGIRFGSTASLQIGNVTEPVAYSGRQSVYPGLDQVNAVIPRLLAGSGQTNVTLTVDGIASNTVTITIR